MDVCMNGWMDGCNASVPFGGLLFGDGWGYGDEFLTGNRAVASICCIKIWSVQQTQRICWEKPNFVDLGVTDDVTGQVKVKMSEDFECLALSRTGAVWNGNKSM